MFVATANTMVAYTARMAVIAKHGVKRTAKSRLANALIMDTTVLRDAPPESGLAGIGDAAAMYVAFGDWWLGKRFGLGHFLQASSDLTTDAVDICCHMPGRWQTARRKAWRSSPD